jgi:quinohemoprotein ethanol dehydrogenase
MLVRALGKNCALSRMRRSRALTFTVSALGVVTLAVGSALGRTGGEAGAGDVNWPGYGNDTKEQRFSTLTQIDDHNIHRLGLVWSLDLPGENALEATPLEVDGTIYFSGGFSAVYAVDVRTGKLLWKYDPKENEAAPREIRRGLGNNRGVAYWDGKVYVATKDCRMIAVDAHTGRLVWSSSFLVSGSNATSTGAPRIFKSKVIIGNSGAEFAARGYVTAFDAQTGKFAWRFFTVPGDPAKGFENDAMAMAAKTWGGEWWKYGGGGTPWNAITFDEELNQIYIGTGNGGPWNGRFRAPRGEDNLFLASVVALDSDTGEYKWHYQYNPDEVWDYKATADIILTDLTSAGKPRKVLMQAPTNGFFYVIDRYTGKLISAEKIGKVTWADRIDLQTGRPVEMPGIRYESGPIVMYPDQQGTHNWQAMSYNPGTGLVYIPRMQVGMKTQRSPTIEEATDVTEDPAKISIRVGILRESHLDKNDPMDGKGSLLAWDPKAQKPRWRVDYPF